MARERVVIVGSGSAGFECARKLSRTLRRHRNDAEIALISPEDYSLYTSLLPEVAGGLLDPRFVAIPLEQSLPGVRLVNGRVTDVDLSAKTVGVASEVDDGRRLGWDRLVLTPGSVTRLFDIPGLKQHARGLKTIAEAIYLRDHVLHQLELAVDEPDPGVRDARRTVVVVGASYAGTELVAQLRALADTVTSRQGVEPTRVRFVLLDLAEQVMPEIGPELGARVAHLLGHDLGVDVRLGHTLKEVTGTSVTVDDDSVIGTYTVAWVTGVTGAPLVAELGLDMDHGRLTVGADLELPGHPDVWACGDAAAVPDLTKPGKICPPTAQHAFRQGSAAARNVAASLGVGQAQPYRHHDLGMVVDLGPHHAVARPLGVRLSGLPAKAMTRGYHLYAVPHPANRWQVGMGWFTDLFTQRPTVRFGLAGASESSFADEPGR